MARAGVAVLPDHDTSERLVAFGERWRHELGEPRLGLDHNLPHVTLHQVPVATTGGVVHAVDGVVVTALGDSFLGPLSYQPVGWIFSDVVSQAWMLTLQAACVAAIDPVVDRGRLRPEASLDGYGPAERESYRRHGYRYVGATFRPHVTLGRVDAGGASVIAPPVSDDCLADHRRSIEGRRVSFERVVVYRAGPHGSLVEILAQLPLRT